MGPRIAKLVAVLALLMGTMTFGGAVSAATAPPPPVIAPPPLTQVVLATAPQGGVINFTTCKGTPGTSFTYSFLGNALTQSTVPPNLPDPTGYTGTFTSTVTGTIVPGNDPMYSTLASLTETFTIHSQFGDVTGTASLLTSSPTPVCYQDAANYFFDSDAPLSYKATIHTLTGGTYTDAGIMYSSINSLNSGQPTGHGSLVGFYGFFISSQINTTPTAPTSTGQCANGGYNAFPQFKNQGDCNKYVNTGK